MCFLRGNVTSYVACFILALMISLLVKSQYVVDETQLTTQFGFIKSKFPLKDFTSMELDRDEHKLIVYSGESYMVIKVCAEWQDDFASVFLWRQGFLRPPKVCRCVVGERALRSTPGESPLYHEIARNHARFRRVLPTCANNAPFPATV